MSSSTAYPQATPKSAEEVTNENLAIILSCVALLVFASMMIGIWYAVYGRDMMYRRRRYVRPQPPSSSSSSQPPSSDVEVGVIGPHQEDGRQWAVSTIESLKEAADREAKQ
ncbi:hypothetical protein ACJ41O_010629 [Fusarium nematophilum]